MANDYKVLGQQVCLDSTEDVYTVPSATQTVVSTITVANLDEEPNTFRIAVRPAGAAISLEHYIAYNVQALAHEAFTWTVGITLEATDVVTVRASDDNGAINGIAFSVFGQEIT